VGRMSAERKRVCSMLDQYPRCVTCGMGCVAGQQNARRGEPQHLLCQHPAGPQSETSRQRDVVVPPNDFGYDHNIKKWVAKPDWTPTRFSAKS